MEFAILDFIQENFRSGILDTVMTFITGLGDSGKIWIACTFLLLLIPKTRKAGTAMGIALVLEIICCNIILKPFVARIRPCDVNTAVQLLIERPLDYSFPSGHTASSLAAASALYFSRKKLWIPGRADFLFKTLFICALSDRCAGGRTAWHHDWLDRIDIGQYPCW